MNRNLISIVVSLFVLIAVGGTGYYFFQQSRYIQTDNATIQADLIPITVSQTGKVVNWSGKEGQKVKSGDKLGEELVRMGSTSNSAGDAKMTEIKMPWEAPTDGTIVKTNVFNHQVVSQGQTIAYIADLSMAYVVAYIDETDIKDLSVGQEVDVNLDIEKDQTYKGIITQIGNVAGNVLASSGTVGTKKTSSPEKQRVSVKITLKELATENQVLGTNAEVKIYK